MSRLCLHVLTASFVLALGCSKLPLGQKTGPGGSAASESAADPAAAADEKISEKIEEYLKACLNNYVRTEFRNSADSYLDNIDEKKGPTESKIPYLYKINVNGVQECETAVLKARAMQPPLPELDAAMTAYVAAIKGAAPTINDAQTYYDQKDYKDDKLAKGKALHPQLVEVLKNVRKASRAMSDAFTQVKDPLDKRDLERLKAKGPKVAYLTKRSVMNTDVFVKTLNVKSVKEFFDLPAADLQAKIDVMAQDLTDLQQLVAAKGKELEGTSGVDSYTNHLQDFLKEAKEVTRRIRDKKKFTDSELNDLGSPTGWTTAASPDRVDHSHEELIQEYNRMRL